MSLLRRFFGGGEARRSLSGRDVWGPDYNLSATTIAGEQVNTETALTDDMVWAATTLTANTVASLPLQVFRGEANDPAKVRLDPQPTWIGAPTNEDTTFSLLFKTVMSYLLTGNAFFEVIPNARTGDVVELWPLNPAAVSAVRIVDDNGRPSRLYNVSLDNGQNVQVTHTSRQDPGGILHITYAPRAGHIMGMSPVQYAAETIGESLAARRYGAGFFERSGMPGGVIETAVELTQEEVDDLMAAWDSFHRGGANAYRPGVLTGGAQFKEVALSNADLQFLETRTNTAQAIARIFAVPLHLVNLHDKATTFGAGIAELNRAWWSMSVRAHLRKIEQPITRWLLANGQVALFDASDVLNSAPAEHVDMLARAVQGGLMSQNEARGRLDLPEVDGPYTDDVFYPLNLTPSSDPAQVTTGGDTEPVADDDEVESTL